MIHSEIETDGAGHAGDVAFESPFPDACVPEIYRTAYPDLVEFDRDALLEHFEAYGASEGRRGNELFTREDFVNLIPGDAEILEIGPYYNPLLRGARVKYFDVRSQAEMQERAALEGYDAAGVPVIDFVSASCDLTSVDRQFEYVVSSHCIEHQPDLIKHIQDVETLLKPGGCYFVIMPDKRYCFDHFMPESTLADVLEAHVGRRRVHTVASVIEHRVLMTHNDAQRHWDGDHGNFMENAAARTRAALEEIAEANGAYIDVHAWYFVPETTARIFPVLHELGYTGLTLERLYPTRAGALEFWFILRKAA